MAAWELEEISIRLVGGNVVSGGISCGFSGAVTKLPFHGFLSLGYSYNICSSAHTTPQSSSNTLAKKFLNFFLVLSTTREFSSNPRILSLVLIQIHYNNGNLQCNKDSGVG
jgi:hypothetical protein